MSRPVEPALPPSTLCGTWLPIISLSFASQRLLAVARQERRPQTTESDNKAISKYQEVAALAHEIKDPVWEATAPYPTCSTSIAESQKQKALDVGNQAPLVNEREEPQNEFLRLNDIYNLRLKADLVVISACKTGLGKDIKGERLV